MSPLRYHQLCFKASHNSYLIPIDGSPPWDPGPQLDGGVRGLELDIVQRSGQPLWSVSHGGSYSPRDEFQFSVYLGAIDAWARTNPGQDPIQLHIDLKGTSSPIATFAPALDAYIAASLRSCPIFRPGDLLVPPAPDIVRSVRANGWSNLSLGRRAYVVCLSGSQTRKADYADYRPLERLCFADIDLPAAGSDALPITTGNRVVLNCPATDWKWGCVWLNSNPGFLLRVYTINRSPSWTAILGHGPNILATDKPNAPWASVGPELFAPTLSPPNPFGH